MRVQSQKGRKEGEAVKRCYCLVLVLALAATAVPAMAWSGPIDFPIDTQLSQVQGPPNEIWKEQVTVGTANGWVPLDDFVKRVQAAIAMQTSTDGAYAAVKALQDPANPASATKVFDAADVDRLIRTSCYVYDAGKHPIWLRVRVSASDGTTAKSWHPTDQWWEGRSSQLAEQHLKTYFVTRFTAEVPVQTRMGRTVETTHQTKTVHQIREWIDP